MTCDHNVMVLNDDLKHVWTCAKCGYVYVDLTEARRREMIANGEPYDDLLMSDGERWTTEELRRDFEVQGFFAPFVVVKRKADGVVGAMEFTHSPRVYFNFKPDGK